MSPFKSFLARLLCLCMVIAAVASKSGISKRAYYARPVQNGLPVTGREFSFLVSIRLVPKELHRCGGFMVSRVHVMTTASCVYSLRTKDIRVYMNAIKFEHLGTNVKVKDLKTHPNFTMTPQDNDIAVLTLEKPYNSPFPFLPEWANVPLKTNVLSFGWGYDKIPGGVGSLSLRMYRLQIASNSLCSLVLREFLSCDTLCATSPIRFATSRADIGTPLIHVDKEGRMYAVGILVRETFDLVNAAAYMALNKFLDWAKIHSNGGLISITPTMPSASGEIESNPGEPSFTWSPPTELGFPETEDTEEPFIDYEEQPIKGFRNGTSS